MKLPLLFLTVVFINALIFVFIYNHGLGMDQVCAYGKECQPSTEDTPTPTISPLPPTPIMEEITPTELLIPTQEVSDTPTPTPTSETQIGTPASADNSAGASASVPAPTSAPATGRAR